MADQKFRLSFSGKIIENKTFDEAELSKHFTIKESFDLIANRSDSLTYEKDLTDEQIVQLEMADGLEWIGYADDIPSLYGEESSQNRSDGTESYHMTPEISDRGSSSRSTESSIRNAVLDIIVPKASDLTAKLLARIVDNKKCSNPGLHQVNANGDLVAAGKLSKDLPNLIFIHGTISSFEDGFSEIEPDLWEDIMAKYDGRVYAFNHRTLSESPIENALELLEKLPESGNFDLISHSRGGLVADVLSRCDHRNELVGFDQDDIDLIEKDFNNDPADDNTITESIEKLNKLARKKNIAINKVVRVACPAHGTTLLSKRIDHFLNAILSLIGLSVGSKLNPFYQYFKLFLLKVVEEKSDPESFPGLWSMVPDSAFQVVNNKKIKISSELYSIAGDSKVGGSIWHSLKVILTNLYYWDENDFVVNTDSMNQGLTNRSLHSYHKIQNKKIQHFSYFSIKPHMEVVMSALNNKLDGKVDWTNLQENHIDRGVLKLIDLGALKPQLESGTRPIVILIPGIMGSNLYHNKQRQWLDFEELHRGGLVRKLNAEDYSSTSAESVISQYYKAFKDYLTSNHDVIVHPFDWRQSLSESVEGLSQVIKRALSHNQPVRIVSHSMGGLLVRQWKLQKKAEWNSFRSSSESRWIMLGTPWGGSHLITEVFTGASKRIKQLNLIDWKNSKRELLESLVEHKGFYDLLPVTDSSIDKMSKWNDLQEAAGDRHMAPVPAEQLKYYLKYKNQVKNVKISAEDKDIIYYVAGKTKHTICDYEIKYSFFRGKYVDFKHTEEGDGSVTWATGIPKGISSDHLYYIDVEHGDLANEPKTFSGLQDLIEKGTTFQSAFSKKKLTRGHSRGGSVKTAQQRELPLLQSDPIDNIFGINRYEEEAEPESAIIEVEVFNGDLKWSQHPLMVGHFVHDGIVSAERTIDRYLNNKLSERHLMGFYPGKIGEQDIIIDHAANPKGAIVIGLGDKDYLTGFNLSKSVEKAMLKYAVFFRDNNMVTDNGHMKSSVSTLIIGSNYGKLPMKESVRSILIGIQNANKMIQEFDDLTQITKVEFVDYYEDNAYECYKILQEIEAERNVVDIALKNDITVGYRNKKRLLRDESHSWWQSFSTELKIEDDCNGRHIEYLDFGTYNRQASASKEKVHVNMDLARYIADELSTVQEWDPVNSKVIFEMLLPNRYKDFIRNHRNIEWRLDIKAATFPWEMFHDFSFGDKPTFIESGLIRQLYSMDANIRPALVRKKSALVIADPIFKKDELPQLPGAKAEGKMVANLLNNKKYKVEDKISSNPLSIVKTLFSGAFKVLHIASHGLYNIEEGKVGIAIGDGQLLTPGTLNQMTAIPEFVFINCCFSGKIETEDQAYTKGRNRLAANIGTQLIEMGVKAVVVAGWAVYDPAAELFAQSLYTQLLDGEYFGDAVKEARRECYEAYSKYNTWGAYQCYGDQFYRLSSKYSSHGNEVNLTLEQEIVMELDNVLSSARSLEISIGDQRSIKWISERMQVLVERAEKLGKYSSAVIEKEAMILTYLGKYTQAVVKYKELLSQDDGMFHVDSMDIYCNIRAKNLVTCLSGQCDITKDKLSDVLRDMNSITLISAGPRRLSTMGSTYKRAAMLADKLVPRREYLEKSAEYYLEAAKLIGVEKRASIYQMTTFITVASFCNHDLAANRVDIKKELGVAITTYLDQWIKTVDTESSDRTDIYDQLAKIQLRMTAMIVGHGKKAELAEEIIGLYQKQISRCINLKDLIGEIEWIDFQIFMCRKFGKTYKNHIKHFTKVKEFLQGYYGKQNLKWVKNLITLGKQTDLSI